MIFDAVMELLFLFYKELWVPFSTLTNRRHFPAKLVNEIIHPLGDVLVVHAEVGVYTTDYPILIKCALG